VALHVADPKPFGERVGDLERVIEAFRPDIVHSHEIQHGGVLVEAARRRAGEPRPPWLVTNWGSDIYWFGRDPRKVKGVRDVLSGCDYYSGECHRDVALGRAFGLRGRVIGVWPVTGGVDIEHAATLRTPGPTSARRAIAVKGAVSTIGQGINAFTAVERCADLLGGWEVWSYQMDPDLGERYGALASEAGFRYTQLSDGAARDSPHDALLAMHGRARVSLGLNRSDGLSVSFVEALAMGAFPIHSSSSCGGEITWPGRGALFVDPLDPDAVAAALRRGLTDDALVDRATALNARVVDEHIDRRRIRARVIDAYERIVADTALMAA
jgi:glycosyltransferase involved in cell wall biosynthesis